MNKLHQETRVVVADAVRARFFRVSPPEFRFEEFHSDMAQHVPQPPHSTLKEEGEDLVSLQGRTTQASRGDMGRSHESASPTRHIIESRSTDAALDRTAFAQRIVNHLEQQFRNHRFDRLVLVMPSRMLGEVHPHLSKPLKSILTHEVDHDWTSLPPSTLQDRLRDTLGHL
jgi:protein required for attachment to host cells